MPKILYVATVVKTHIMQFHIPALEMLKNEGWETSVAAKNDYDDPGECAIPHCDNYYDIDFSRSPFSFKNIKAYRDLKKIIQENDFDIVHCHTPVGGVVARLAAKKSRKNGTKVIYTAHGFHFYKGAPLKNWMLFYPVEYLLSKITDILITINKEDYQLAQKRFKAGKTVYIPGVGIDITKFDRNRFSADFIQDKRASLGLRPGEKMVLSIGELIPRKNHEVTIRAIHKLNDPNVKLFIVGQGKLMSNLQSLIFELGLEKNVFLLGYRYDVAELLCCADLFVLASKQEGLPVVLMEAIASRTKAICSDVRGCRDLVGKEALFEQYNVESVSRSISDHLYDDYTFNNLQQYELSNILIEIKTLYS